MNQRRIFSLVLIYLSIIITFSNVSITGAVVGSGLSNLMGFLALVFFVVGVFLMVLRPSRAIRTSGIENRVVGSRVKKDPLLLRAAQSLGNKASRDVNHLIEELNRGHVNAGAGTKTILPGVYEMRMVGPLAGRLYFRNIGSFTDPKYEILGYSDKDSQKSVIARLRKLY